MPRRRVPRPSQLRCARFGSRGPGNGSYAFSGIRTSLRPSIEGYKQKLVEVLPYLPGFYAPAVRAREFRFHGFGWGGGDRTAPRAEPAQFNHFAKLTIGENLLKRWIEVHAGYTD